VSTDCSILSSRLILVYLTKGISPIPEVEWAQELLLIDDLLVKPCGSNAYQDKKGSCEGESSCARSLCGSPEDLCVDTLANQILEISPQRIVDFFNYCIQKLAKVRVLLKYIHLFMRPVICDFRVLCNKPS